MIKGPKNEEYNDYEKELDTLRPGVSLALVILSLMTFTYVYMGIYTGFLKKKTILLSVSAIILGLLLITSAIFSIKDIIRYFKNRKTYNADACFICGGIGIVITVIITIVSCVYIF